MTPIDPTTLKPGDKVSHAEAPELLFKVVDLPKDLCLGGKKEGATPEGGTGDIAKVEAESAAAVGA